MSTKIKPVPQTLSGGFVAIADGVGVDVVVALALLAGPHLAAPHPHGVAEVTVVTKLAAGAGASLGALGADGALWHVGHLDAGAAIGAGAGLAVVGSAGHGVAVEPSGTLLAVLAVSVVPALAFACKYILNYFRLLLYRILK